MLNALIITANLILLSFLGWKTGQKENHNIRLILCVALGVKIISGVALGFLYKYYYASGDTFFFFQEGSTLSALAREDIAEYIQFLIRGDATFPIWEHLYHDRSRTLFFSKMVSVVNLITSDNYWLTSVYFSFISFLGAWYLVKKIMTFFSGAASSAIVAFLFFPSVIFWSSGVIKEAIAIPGLLFLSGVFLMMWHKQRLRVWEWILLPVALVCVWKLKYFYLGVFIPIAAATLITKHIHESFFVNSTFTKQVLTWFFLSGIGLVLINFIHPNFQLDYIPEVIVMNYHDYVRFSKPGNVILFNGIESTWLSLIEHSPKALFSGLFRPFIWEADSLVKLLSGLENLVLFILIMSIYKMFRQSRKEYGLMTFAIVVYVVILCILLTLSTPNLGTLARYRIGFLPFLVFIILYRNLWFDRTLKNAQRILARLARQN